MGNQKRGPDTPVSYYNVLIEWREAGSSCLLTVRQPALVSKKVIVKKIYTYTRKNWYYILKYIVTKKLVLYNVISRLVITLKVENYD